MKNLIAHVKTNGQKLHSHVKKHHKKYLFGLVSAALLFKIVPLIIASMFTTKLHFSFADDIPWSDNSGMSVTMEEFEEDLSGEISFDDESDNIWVSWTQLSGSSIFIADAENLISQVIEDSWNVINTEPEIQPVSIQQIAPIPWTSYTGPSIAFAWSGNAQAEIYSWYQIKVYSGNECAWDTYTWVELWLDSTWTEITWFVAWNYCWSISASWTQLTGTVSTGFTVIDPVPEIQIHPVLIQQIAPIPWTSYTGPSIDFVWSGNAQTEFYSWYQIKIYSGSDCSGTAIIATWVSLNTTWIRLTWFSSWNYCWSISASWAELIGTVSTWFVVIPASIDSRCDTDDIEILSPTTWEIIRWTKQLLWNFVSEDCDGRKVMVAVNTWGTSNYPVVRSWLIPGNTWYIYDSTWVAGWTLAIYISSWDEKDFPVKEYTIDNLAPTITWATYRFDKATTGWYFGINHVLIISFTWSEALTGIVVNVMWKDAQLDSNTWLRYTYKTSFSWSVNTWTLQFNIKYKDLAWNQWVDYTKNDTWYRLDNERPNLSWAIKFLFARSTGQLTMEINLTETWRIELYYSMSWSNKWKSNIPNWKW